MAPRLRLERRAQRRGGPRIAGRNGHWLVGDELGLHDDARVGADRLDDVTDRGDPPVDERDETHGRDVDGLAGGRHPADLAAQDAPAEVELALVGAEMAVADVEGLVVDDQAEDLAVGHVDDRLARLRVAVSRLGVRQRPQLMKPVR